MASFFAEVTKMKRAGVWVVLAAASVLGVAACGGGAGPVPATSPAASRTATPSPSPPAAHSAKPGEPAMIAVPGYDYLNPPGGTLGKLRQQLKHAMGADTQAIKSMSVHGVTHEGTLVAAIVLLQVHPAYAALPGFQQAVVPSMARGMAGSGVHVRMNTIHSEKVAVAKSASETAYAWYHNGVITAVVGSNGPDIRDYVDAYLQTAHTTHQ